MSSTVLGDKDVNAAQTVQATESKDIKSMEYHRQVLQSRLEEDKYVSAPHSHRIIANPQRRGKPTYVSPSDNIMSPCTAKLSAYRNKHVMKYVPFPFHSSQLLRTKY